MTHTIKFSEPWDKLKNIDGFTTIRSSNPEKASYYKGAVGRVFEISLNGTIVGRAILKSAIETYGAAIPDSVLNNDVKINGKINYAWHSKIRRMKKVLILNFERKYSEERKLFEVEK